MRFGIPIRKKKVSVGPKLLFTGLRQSLTEHIYPSPRQ